MCNDLEFKDFRILDFPENIEAVYVMLLVKNDTEIPFYVGETRRFWGRVSDYISAGFKAPTDFKVGEAIRYLRKRGLKVIIKYKPSDNRKKDQDNLIKYIHGKRRRLLNDLAGYNYRTSSKAEERSRVIDFCDSIVT
jgi:hypothetical protein